MKRLAAALALALAVVPAVAHADQPASPPEAPAAAAGGAIERDVVEVHPSKKRIKIVTVDNQLGDVRIEGHDGKHVIIVAEKRAPDEDALDQLKVSLVPDPDGPVRITTAIDRAAEKTTLPSSAVRIDLVIRAPRNARVDARVGRGELTVRNMDAGGDLDAGAGAITVENVAGTVYARSVEGDQTFEEVFGDLDAQALDADLSFDVVRSGAFVASVHDGTIEARRIKAKRIELRTTRGRIHLESELAIGGTLVVASRHGDLDVRVKSAGALKVKALAGGALDLAGAERTVDAETAWVRARYGKSKRSAAIELRSKYGDVRFEVVE